MEFLDMALQEPKKTNEGPSILQMNLFVALASCQSSTFSSLFPVGTLLESPMSFVTTIGELWI
jgi:hypothetical protein